MASNMTVRERLLALEAALCACEGVPFDTEGYCFGKLRNYLDKHLDGEGDTFLRDQKLAVKKLADSPQVFGG